MKRLLAGLMSRMAWAAHCNDRGVTEGIKL
jgi:hypothetical protein